MGVEKVRRRLSVQGARLTVPHVNAALSQSNLSTTSGDMRLGHSAGTVQIGLTVNGTAYILSGTVGGAVTLGTAS